MTKTRSKTVPVLGGVVVLALVVGGYRASSNQPSGVESYRCKGDTAAVNLEVSLGKVRPVKISYEVGDEARIVDVTTDWWTLTDEEVSCNTDVVLMVNRRDVWGGKTECRIEIDGDLVARDETTGQGVCRVVAYLRSA